MWPTKNMKTNHAMTWRPFSIRHHFQLFLPEFSVWNARSLDGCFDECSHFYCRDSTTQLCSCQNVFSENCIIRSPPYNNRISYLLWDVTVKSWESVWRWTKRVFHRTCIINWGLSVVLSSVVLSSVVFSLPLFSHTFFEVTPISDDESFLRVACHCSIANCYFLRLSVWCL